MYTITDACTLNQCLKERDMLLRQIASLQAMDADFRISDYERPKWGDGIAAEYMGGAA